MSRIKSYSSRHKKTLLLLGTLLVIICLTVAYFFITKIGTSSKNKGDEVALSQDNSKPTAQSIRESTANDFFKNNDPKSAISVLDEGITSTTDKQEQSIQYIRMAVILYDYDSVGYKDQILAAAYKAEEIYPSARSATLISDIETRYGNEVAAKKYLEILDERTKNDSKDLE